MVRVTDNNSNQQSGGHTGKAGTTTFNAADYDGGDMINLPDGEFLANADITREGQDLVLKGPDGTTIIIENYFNAMPAPDLGAPDGSVLTPDLVNSFLTVSPQFARAETMSDVSPVGHVTEADGHATVRHPDGTVETVTIGTAIYQGDVIETDEHGGVNIQFIDESTFAVSESARLAVDEYVFDPASESGTQNFSILRGVFVYTSGLIGREDPDDVEIDTPVGSIGIRGTVIAGHIVPDGDSQITVVEGAIVVTNGYGEQTLSTQYETVTLSGYNAEITNIGALDGTELYNSYGSASSVAAEVFVGFGSDSGSQNSGSDTMSGTPDSGSGEPSADDGSNAAPASGESSSTDTQASPDKTGDASGFGSDPIVMDAGFGEDPGSSFDGSTDTFSGSGDTILSAPAPTGDTSSGTSAPPPPPPPSGDTTASFQDPPPPPPDGSGGGSGGSSGGSGGTTGPVALDSYAGAFAAANLDMITSWGNGKFLYSDTNGQIFVRSGGTSTSLVGGVGNIVEIAGLGDFNGDGTIDFAWGNPDADLGATTNTGQGGIYIDGNTNDGDIYSSSFTANTRLGEAVSDIGDINGDGLSDMLITAPGSNQAYAIYGSSSTPTWFDPSTFSALDGFSINGTTGFGMDASSAGDFDNDGFGDYLISNPTAGNVMLYYGNDGTADATITNFNIGADNEIPMFQTGDMNGDGISDMALVSTGDNAMHFYWGGSAITDLDVSNGVSNGGFSFKVTNTNAPTGMTRILDGGGAIGDFNGDGYDDFTVVLRNDVDTVADIFVVFGHPGLEGTLMTEDDLFAHPENAMHLTYDTGVTSATGFDFEISGIGDSNGDGFDDFAIGVTNDNKIYVVEGQNDRALSPDGQEVHIANQTSPDHTVHANSNGDHLVGDAGFNELNSYDWDKISMSGGAGDDLLKLGVYGVTTLLNASNLGNLDGGSGVDTVQFFSAAGTLDFSQVGSEGLTGVEKFELMTSGQTIKLNMDDIFRLMQQSDSGELWIHTQGDANVGTLILDDLDGSNEAGGAETIDTETAMTIGGGFDDTNGATGDNFNSYDFGGYTLFIDDDINVDVV